jgi:hypothetical protein
MTVNELITTLEVLRDEHGLGEATVTGSYAELTAVVPLSSEQVDLQ